MASLHQEFLFFSQAAPTRQYKFSVSILGWWELSLETRLCWKTDFLTWKIKTKVTEISLDEKIHKIFSANHNFVVLTQCCQNIFMLYCHQILKNSHFSRHHQILKNSHILGKKQPKIATILEKFFTILILFR